MMTRKADQLIDDNFLRMRVQNAWDYRKQVMAGGNDNVSDLNCCRVIFGEADFLPGITVDKYADVLVVECLALGMEQFKVKIVELLKEVLAADGINIRGVYERSDANERKKEGLPKVKGFIGAEFDTNVEIVENAVHYMVDVENGQKTGFFLDQKYNRLAMQRICKGKRVLDCFTHMGTFALNAGIAGARNSFSLVKKKVSNVLLDSLDECTVSISTKEDNCSSLKSLNNLFSKTVLFVICVLWHFRGLKPGLRFKSMFLAVNRP